MSPRTRARAPLLSTRNVAFGTPATALDQRRVSQDPAIEGAVVHRQAALPEQLLNIAVAQRIAQIPADCLQDQRRIEVAALEVVLDRRFSFSAIALRIGVSLRTGGKLTATPDEPSTPEICDRPRSSC